ncbi:molybdate ABC transporter substrate-binding protein [uncultured Photobacterium sp.]|uniref:molybdate ABC transporter substrate-binding protein n=1 Tax=uncultured Photobacterium sp. TaxID=173973 RepID=UPI00262A3740|nr:molybdate ABC transporter substrate-binding protein [uncultured Photobacterium sp.]
MNKRLLTCLFSVSCVLGVSNPAWAADKVTIFAAASLTNAMNEVAAVYKEKTGMKSTLSFASSSTLARQIAQGAPADIYLSANEKWMDYVEKQQAIEPQSRKSLLKNSLVLVAPDAYPADKIEVNASWDIAKALDGTRLATGDPKHVPAGIYAKESLENIGLWQKASPLLARANNVRSALLLVEKQEAMLGIVYKTDALISDKVKVVAELPNNSHAAITYPIAIVKDKSDEQVEAYYEFLQSDQAREIFEKYGFGVN